MSYLITGATGNIGSLVVERLLALKKRPRIFVRNVEKARARFGDRVDIAAGDLSDARSLGRAMTGIHAVFLVNSEEGLDERDATAAKVANHDRRRSARATDRMAASAAMVGPRSFDSWAQENQLAFR